MAGVMASCVMGRHGASWGVMGVMARSKPDYVMAYVMVRGARRHGTEQTGLRPSWQGAMARSKRINHSG